MTLHDETPTGQYTDPPGPSQAIWQPDTAAVERGLGTTQVEKIDVIENPDFEMRLWADREFRMARPLLAGHAA